MGQIATTFTAAVVMNAPKLMPYTVVNTAKRTQKNLEPLLLDKERS